MCICCQCILYGEVAELFYHELVDAESMHWYSESCSVKLLYGNWYAVYKMRKLKLIEHEYFRWCRTVMPHQYSTECTLRDQGMAFSISRAKHCDSK